MSVDCRRAEQRRAFSSNDVLIASQWRHPVIGSDLAWDKSLGRSDVRIAIADTPFQLGHPDLASHAESGWDTVERRLGHDHLALGEFIEFKASCTHTSELGGQDTSVMQSLSAQFTAHQVLNDQPGRDGIRDFLADTDNDANQVPDALYESDGNALPVNYLTNAAAVGSAALHLSLDGQPGHPPGR
jgi:hypothetical protein